MSRKVVVTGGAAGIGLAIARAFIAAGSEVWVCDADPTALAELRITDVGLHASLCDVADREAARAFVTLASASMGGIDVLVDNAGIGGMTAPIDEIAAESWNRVLDVNLSGTFHITQAATPSLRSSPAGVIIVVSSLAGRFGYSNRLAYATTKWGLVGFTKSLAIELGGDGIRVNAVLPGAVAGDRLDAVFRARANISGQSIETVIGAALDNQSIREFVTADQVAATCLFLASDAARTISGQIFPIDGDSRAAQ